MDKTETLAPATSVLVSGSLLKAALACASTDPTRGAAHGVYLHRVGNDLRVVGIDGKRLFVGASRFSEEADLPEWLDQGVILHAEGLKQRLSLLTVEGSLLRVSYASGLPRAELSDLADSALFRHLTVAGRYANYQHIIGANAGCFSTEDHGDFRPVGFEAGTLKGVGEIAKILGGKEDRVGVYARDENSPAIVTFAAQPGALLYVLPIRVEVTMPETTAAILDPAIRGTLAAMRAHLTRHQKVVDNPAASASDKAAAQARVDDYATRIQSVLDRTGYADALPPPAAEEPPAAAKPAPRKPAKGKAKGKAAKPEAAATEAPAPTAEDTPESVPTARRLPPPRPAPAAQPVRAARRDAAKAATKAAAAHA